MRSYLEEYKNWLNKSYFYMYKPKFGYYWAKTDILEFIKK